MTISTLHPVARHATLACLGTLLTACSTSYVVLLPNADGSVGKVQVTGERGSNLLTQPLQGARVGAHSGATFMASPEEVQTRFAAALAASPSRPARFILYFETGGTRLTADSEQTLAKVLAEIESRPVPDISVTGHTDTSGDAAQNLSLGLERARQVRALLVSDRLDHGNVTIESHGEKNLLVPTPDNTDEPRNRRVEVTVR